MKHTIDIPNAYIGNSISEFVYASNIESSKSLLIVLCVVSQKLYFKIVHNGKFHNSYHSIEEAVRAYNGI